MQYGFYRYALLADSLWVAVEKAFTKNSSWNVPVWSIIMKDH